MMNKIAIFIIILIGFVQVSFAQIHFKDSTEAYNYWAKRGVIEATYAYMQDYIITVGKSNAKPEIVGKNKYLEAFIQDIDSKEPLPSFAQISKLLEENSWSGAEKKLFNPLVRNFENKKTLDGKFFNTTKPGSEDMVTVIPGQNNLNQHWNSKIDEILSNYNESLLSLKKEEPKLVESNPKPNNFENNQPKSEIKQSEEKSYSKPKEINWVSFLLYVCFFIVGTLVGGWLIYSISKNQIYSILITEKRYYLKKYFDEDRNFIFRFIGVVYVLKKQKDLHKKESESANQNSDSKSVNLEQKTSLLEKEKIELPNENIELGERLDGNIIHEKEGKNESHNAKSQSFNSQPTAKIAKLYFSMPEINGSFQLSNGESSNDGKKYFKISYNEGDKIGDIAFLTGARDQRAINRLESYLKPVCEIENIANASTASRIELISKGKVQLHNDSWVIDPTNKIKVKLI